MTFLRCRKRPIRWPKVVTGQCEYCKGEGNIPKFIEAGGSVIKARVTCPVCKGTCRDQHREE